MSQAANTGYKFGCTYVGTKQYNPQEAFPIIIGDIDPNGNMNSQILHHFTKNIRTKIVNQIQQGKFVASQVSGDYIGDDFTASATLGNTDIVNESGVMVCQYLQNLTKRFSVGSEILYQYGSQIPGKEIAVYSLASRYIGDSYVLSGSLTPMAGGVHLSFFQKASETLQIGAELEASLRSRECVATVGYSLELPTANLMFKGQVDSNWCVSAVFEKKLLPLPFTFAISGHADQVKSAYKFGLGLVVG